MYIKNTFAIITLLITLIGKSHAQTAIDYYNAGFLKLQNKELITKRALKSHTYLFINWLNFISLEKKKKK